MASAFCGMFANRMERPDVLEFIRFIINWNEINVTIRNCSLSVHKFYKSIIFEKQEKHLKWSIKMIHIFRIVLLYIATIAHSKPVSYTTFRLVNHILSYRITSYQIQWCCKIPHKLLSVFCGSLRFTRLQLVLKLRRRRVPSVSRKYC